MTAPPVAVGRLRLPRLDKTFASGGGAKWKGRKEGTLAVLVHESLVGIQIGHECVELDHAQREEFARIYFEATRQADACAAEAGDAA